MQLGCLNSRRLGQGHSPMQLAASEPCHWTGVYAEISLMSESFFQETWAMLSPWADFSSWTRDDHSEKMISEGKSGLTLKRFTLVQFRH